MQLNISLLARPWFGIRYDSHQLLCGWMVEVNSKPFRIVGRDLVGVYTCTLDRLENRKWRGLIGSLPANQVAAVSIHLF